MARKKQSDRQEEFCDEEGAKKIVSMIKKYWADKGHNVDVRADPGSYVSVASWTRYDVRSSMLNGYPIGH